MRRVLALLLLPLAGCDQGLSSCEEAIKARLKSPATYQRVTSVVGSGSYEIDYDAANAFGTPMRDHARCTLAPDGTAKVTLRSDDERFGREIDDLNDRLHEQLKGGAN